VSAPNLARCQNCAWTGDADDCAEVSDFWGRVSPGEPMPSGECPECGALCQPYEEPDADARLVAAAPDLLEALQNLVSDYDDTGCEDCGVISAEVHARALKLLEALK
jgi:hypothetical protein